MKVLLLSARGRTNAGQIRDAIDDLDLGPDVELELVGVAPVNARLPVSRIDVVDPSLVPRRPLVPVKGAGLATWGGPRRHYVRGLRFAGRMYDRLRTPIGERVSHQRVLARAAATSGELKSRAEAVDVVVALDSQAALAAWHLSRRVDETAVVYRPANARTVLERMGRSLPPKSLVQGTDQARSTSPPMPDLTAGASAVHPRVVIAPANYAGQGSAWARAVRHHSSDTWAMNVRVGAQKNEFPADYFVDRETFHGDLEWRIAWRDFVERSFSHVIVEANLRVLGGGILGTGERHAVELQRAGKTVALLSHGSDARVPSIHAAREQWHSYEALAPSALDKLEEQAAVNRDCYNRFQGTVFVSTPGVLAFVPNGVWLPVVVEPERWSSPVEPVTRDVPVVAHVPSGPQKGSHMIDPILSSLADRGLIEYLRLEGVPHRQMPEIYAAADMMVEQFGIADYSVAACEAMAAGRVVISRVADDVRRHVAATTGLELPIVEANPLTLEQVIVDLLDDRSRASAVAARGPGFVEAVHDGRRSASVIQSWVHSSGPGGADRDSS